MLCFVYLFLIYMIRLHTPSALCSLIASLIYIIRGQTHYIQLPAAHGTSLFQILSV